MLPVFVDSAEGAGTETKTPKEQAMQKHSGSKNSLEGRNVGRNLDRNQAPSSVRALAGPLKDIQRIVQKPVLRCLGCVFGVIVPLAGEPSPQSEVLSALEQVFIKNLSDIYCQLWDLK